MFLHLFSKLRFFVKGRKHGKEMGCGTSCENFHAFRVNSNTWGDTMIMFTFLKCGITGISRAGGSRKGAVWWEHLQLCCMPAKVITQAIYGAPTSMSISKWFNSTACLLAVSAKIFIERSPCPAHLSSPFIEWLSLLHSSILGRKGVLIVLSVPSGGAIPRQK